MRKTVIYAVACLTFASCGGGGGGSNPGGPTVGTPPTAPPATTPTTTPTTTLPAANQPPVIQFTVKPDAGVAPIDVEANLCQSSDPEGRPLSYRFDCKNGTAIKNAFCRETCRYTQDARFDPEGCVSDGVTEKCETSPVRLGPASLPVDIHAAANNACMVEGSADAGGANSFSAMAVTRVSFTLRGPSGSKSIEGRPGSGTQWVMPATQSMGAGSNTLEAEAYNGGKRVGTGKNSRNFTC
ncbi:MAG: hypothetical protein AB7O37_09300 [Vicinamibacteria bacterium]